MDYSQWHIGDKVYYQGNFCANTVSTGSTYEVVELVPNKPKHAFILDESGRKKLIQMSSLFVKIDGK